MVYFYKVAIATDDDGFGLVDRPRVLYMGKDKHENVPLIEHSHPKNLWFHVDNHSSAHVYLQTTEAEQLQNFDLLHLPEPLVTALAQFTKANSIKASKLNNITVIYTPVDNFHTDGLMDDGTVTFKNPKKVKKCFIAKKDNAIVNKVTKSKTEVATSDFIAQQADMVLQWQREKRQKERDTAAQERDMARKYQDQRVRNADPYADLFTEENVRMNDPAYKEESWNEDDFM